MKAEATIYLNVSSQKKLHTILQSLKSETQTMTYQRSQATLSSIKNTLILKIEAQDTVALRAALNSYLRWINTLLEVLKIIGK
jgi:tRNA threonylcarbamoyladenosine modification (KEOPS) complex  Pcc1 subunit